MSQDKIAFEKFFPRPLVFADKAHELEMISKWNDAKINWETSLEAATAEANKRIAELKQDRNDLNYKCMERLHKIEELQASNNHLREAFQKSIVALKKANVEGLITDTIWVGHTETLFDYMGEALSATPAESLQAFENEVIEKCADICDEHGCVWVSKSIRALKEVK